MQETRKPQVWVWLCIGMLVIGLSGCSSRTIKKVGAGTALPFAFMGDSVLMPFQALGHLSQAMIAGGDAVDNYTEFWGGMTADIHHDNPADLFYYIPGYTLSPFIPLSDYEYYGMTTSCMKTLKWKPPSRRDRYYY